jgi:hypothetical protein
MMNWKGFGRKRSWNIFKALSRKSPEGIEEYHEKPSLMIAGLLDEILTQDLPNKKKC